MTKNHSPAELEARLHLHGLPELRPMRFLRLIEVSGSASSAPTVSVGAWRTLGVPVEAATARRSPVARETVGEALRWLGGLRRHLLMWDDPGYPVLLAEVADVPPLLYVEGAPETLERSRLVMIDGHRASPIGLGTAQNFTCSLAQGGLVITNEPALGIDGTAHKGVLKVDGTTVTVLDTGLRRLYPYRHEVPARRIVRGGDALTSKLPLDDPPLSANFLRRSHITNGLSLSVLVVEADPTGGSLIAAWPAARQDHEVYAIPGSIHHPGACGCHQLIRDDALLVESIGYVFKALRGQTQAESAEAPAQPPPYPLPVLLRTAPYTNEGPAAASGMTPPDVLATLSELEPDGWVVCEAGTWVHRSGWGRTLHAPCPLE